jgi:bifunctional DNA-binding transcriptional regulator/antitoxin component of YhaV-PrlF toxin-antitoxin module
MQPTNETTKSWFCDVTENGVLIIPDDLWEQIDWKIGDDIEFIDQEDGSFILQKVMDQLDDDQAC